MYKRQNLEHNDLPAWKQLQRFRKQEEHSGNWTALFDLYHWLCLISARIHVPAFEGLHRKCEMLLQEQAIKAERISIYYFNLSGVYHNQKEYEKEEYYLCLFLKDRTRQLLPFMFWYIHNQRLQGKVVKKVLAQSYDMRDCSERLQTLWGFFEILPHVDAQTSQKYLMKQCLPLLSELAVEFQDVYKRQEKPFFILCDVCFWQSSRIQKKPVCIWIHEVSLTCILGLLQKIPRNGLFVILVLCT